MEAKHTAMPYYVGEWLEGGRGTPICFGDKEDQAVLAFASRGVDAEFIVRACNAHDDLVAALRGILKVECTVKGKSDVAWDAVHYALAKATGAA